MGGSGECLSCYIHLQTLSKAATKMEQMEGETTATLQGCTRYSALHHLTVRPPTNWFFPGLLFLLASLSFAHLRPYKNDSFNIIDSLLCVVAILFLFSQSVVTAGGMGSTRPYQIFAQLTSLIPLVYIMCYVVYRYVFTPLYRRAKKGREVWMTDLGDSLSATDTDHISTRL